MGPDTIVTSLTPSDSIGREASLAMSESRARPLGSTAFTSAQSGPRAPAERSIALSAANGSRRKPARLATPTSAAPKCSAPSSSVG
eukprot:scaffold315452_cov27-Tisochrysis_lutea.AAC.3